MSAQDPEAIRRLFNEVSPTYDLLNRILSLGCDGHWRRAAAEEVRAQPGDLLLDLCGGTGDLAVELVRRYPDCRVLLVDFAEEMLQLAARKGKIGTEPFFRRPRGRGRQKKGSVPIFPFLACADALSLPLPDRSCAGITVGFGIRNLKDTREGLVESWRVLKRGGRLVILEFMRPEGFLAPVKRFALRSLVPAAVRLVAAKQAPAYRYLSRSIIEYLSVDEMVALMREVGFTDLTVRHQPLGFAWVIGGTRP